MQRQKEKEFEDEGQPKLRIICTQHAALQSFRLMGRLGKLLGPALNAFKGIKFKGQDIGMMAPILASLLEQLEPSEAESLAINLMEGCLAVVAGLPKAIPLNNAPNIDVVFGGRILTMFKVMAFAVEVNYEDFFRVAREAAAKAEVEKNASAASNPEASLSISPRV